MPCLQVLVDFLRLTHRRKEEEVEAVQRELAMLDEVSMRVCVALWGWGTCLAACLPRSGR